MIDRERRVVVVDGELARRAISALGEAAESVQRVGSIDQAARAVDSATVVVFAEVTESSSPLPALREACPAAVVVAVAGSAQVLDEGESAACLLITPPDDEALAGALLTGSAPDPEKLAA